MLTAATCKRIRCFLNKNNTTLMSACLQQQNHKYRSLPVFGMGWGREMIFGNSHHPLHHHRHHHYRHQHHHHYRHHQHHHPPFHDPLLIANTVSEGNIRTFEGSLDSSVHKLLPSSFLRTSSRKKAGWEIRTWNRELTQTWHASQCWLRWPTFSTAMRNQWWRFNNFYTASKGGRRRWTKLWFINFRSFKKREPISYAIYVMSCLC